MRIFIKGTVFISFLSIVMSLFIPAGHAQVYKDPTASVEARVNDLLSRMTLDEKIGQMTQADLSVISKNKNDITIYFISELSQSV